MAESRGELESVPALFPKERGTTEITRYEMSAEIANGRTERRKDFTLVTHGGGRWAVIDFSTHSTGGPDRIVQWSVAPSDTVPPELAMLDSVDRALPRVWAALAILVVGVGALIFRLVRRSRRVHDPWAGRNAGRP